MLSCRCSWDANFRTALYASMTFIEPQSRMCCALANRPASGASVCRLSKARLPGWRLPDAQTTPRNCFQSAMGLGLLLAQWTAPSVSVPTSRRSPHLKLLFAGAKTFVTLACCSTSHGAPPSCTHAAAWGRARAECADLRRSSCSDGVWNQCVRPSFRFAGKVWWGGHTKPRNAALYQEGEHELERSHAGHHNLLHRGPQ